MTIPDNLLRIPAFAKKAGVTRQAIAQLVISGGLPHEEIDGVKYINLKNRAVKQYLTENRQSYGKEKPGKDKTGQSKSKKKTENKNTVGVTEDDIPEYLKNISDTSELTFSQIASLTKNEIEKIKLYEQIKEIKIKNQDKLSERISRGTVRGAFGKMLEIHSNEFLTIKNKVVPDIAAIMECNDPEKMLKAEERLDAELWKTLKHIRYEFERILGTLNEPGTDTEKN